MIYTADEIAAECFAIENAGAFDEKTLRRVEASLTRAEKLVEAFLRRSTAYALRTEVLSLPSEYDPTLVPVDTMESEFDALVLSFTPVQASTLTVHVNEESQKVFGADQLLNADEYQLENVVNGWSATGILRHLSGGWPVVPGGVRVSYFSGETSVYNARNWDLIRLATVSTFRSEYAKSLAFENFASSGAGSPIASESIGKESRSYDVQGQQNAIHGRSLELPDEAKEILQPLINYGVYL